MSDRFTRHCAALALFAVAIPSSILRGQSTATATRPQARTDSPNPVARSASADLVVDVHPGMELIAIMAYLAQNYPTPMDSKYKTDVWSWFGRYRTHSALVAFKAGQLFPDVTELGLLNERAGAPFAIPDSSSWYNSLGRERARTMLRDAGDFAAASHFSEFRRMHVPMYHAWSVRVATELKRSGALDSVRAFYQSSNTPTVAPVRLYLEPLNNWGAHQIDVTRSLGRAADQVVRFQFGPSDDASLPDSPLTFAMSPGKVAIVWHEAGHAYVRSLMSQRATQIASLSRLFDASNEDLRRQNITTWEYALEENIVRSVVAVLIGATRGTKDLEREVARQAGDGFLLVPRITALLQQEYCGHRDRYPTLNDFAPRMLEALSTP